MFPKENEAESRDGLVVSEHDVWKAFFNVFGGGLDGSEHLRRESDSQEKFSPVIIPRTPHPNSEIIKNLQQLAQKKPAVFSKSVASKLSNSRHPASLIGTNVEASTNFFSPIDKFDPNNFNPFQPIQSEQEEIERTSFTPHLPTTEVITIASTFRENFATANPIPGSGKPENSFTGKPNNSAGPRGSRSSLPMGELFEARGNLKELARWPWAKGLFREDVMSHITR